MSEITASKQFLISTSVSVLFSADIGCRTQHKTNSNSNDNVERPVVGEQKQIVRDKKIF